MVISIWGVGVSFGYVMVMHDENLDFVWCFQHFRAVGTSRKGVFLFFFISLVKFMSGEHVASICSRLAPFRLPDEKPWFRVAVYRFYEPWAPVEEGSRILVRLHIISLD